MRLREDLASHRRTVWAFLAFWLALLVLTALSWQAGMPMWLFFIHLLLLPFVAGVATAGFRLNSGIAGVVVSLADLFLVNALPLRRLSLLPQPPLPAENLFPGRAGVLEVLEFVILMGIPGFLLGLFGGWAGRRVMRR